MAIYHTPDPSAIKRAAGTLHPRTRWHNTQPIVERVASFGWELLD